MSLSMFSCPLALRPRRHSLRTLLPAFASILALGTTSSAHAGGHPLFQHGGRGVAQVGALVARADDPSALTYNPAGLAGLDGFQASLGGGALDARDRYQERFDYDPFIGEPSPSFNGSSAGEPRGSVAAAYLTWKDEARLGRFAIGLGLDAPYRSRHEWREGVESVIFDTYGLYALELWQIHPAVAFHASAGLSFGAGLRYLQGDHAVETMHQVFVGDGQGVQHRIGYLADQSARISGVGFDLGALYRSGSWGAGLVYRSGLTVEGDARRSLTPLSEPPDATARGELEQWLERIDGSPLTSRARLPAELVLGVWVAPVPSLRIEANLVNVRWSSYAASLEGHVVDGQSTGSMTLGLGWEDTFAVRLAVEGDISRSVTLAAGYAREPSPIPETTWHTPFAFRGDADIYGLGVTLHRATLSLDLGVSWHRYATVESGVSHPRFGQRESTFASDARLVGISLRQRF